MRNVGRIALDGIVVVHPHPQRFQPLLERIRHRLALIPGQHHRADIQPHRPETIQQTDHILIVGDAQISAQLVFFNIGGVDHNDHFHLFFQLQQHPQLAVRLESGQHTGRMIIVEQFSAKLQIQLAAELGNTVADVFRLHPQILVIIKANLFPHGLRSPPF